MTLNEKKAVVVRFLRQCNEYAGNELARYRTELNQAEGRQALALQDRIGHWTAYMAFNEYTLEELDGDTLDSWFDEPDTAATATATGKGRSPDSGR